MCGSAEHRRVIGVVRHSARVVDIVVGERVISLDPSVITKHRIEFITVNPTLLLTTLAVQNNLNIRNHIVDPGADQTSSLYTTTFITLHPDNLWHVASLNLDRTRVGVGLAHRVPCINRIASLIHLDLCRRINLVIGQKPDPAIPVCYRSVRMLHEPRLIQVTERYRKHRRAIGQPTVRERIVTCGINEQIRRTELVKNPLFTIGSSILETVLRRLRASNNPLTINLPRNIRTKRLQTLNPKLLNQLPTQNRLIRQPTQYVPRPPRRVEASGLLSQERCRVRAPPNRLIFIFDPCQDGITNSAKLQHPPQQPITIRGSQTHRDTAAESNASVHINRGERRLP